MSGLTPNKPNDESPSSEKNNGGSNAVGLPVSTSDEEEEDSSDDALTAVADDLCISLQKEALTPKRKPTAAAQSEEHVTTEELSLEERVQELETKLATLSRILQQQQKLAVRTLLTRSPSNPQRPQSPRPNTPELPLTDGNGHTNQNNNNNQNHPPDSPPQAHSTPKGLVPYLESPTPFDDCSPRDRKMHQRKRLSFRLLYDGNEENLNKGDDEDHQHSIQIHSPRSHNEGTNKDNKQDGTDIEQEQESYLLRANSSHNGESLASETRAAVNSTVIDTAATFVANQNNSSNNSNTETTSLAQSTSSFLDKRDMKSTRTNSNPNDDSSSSFSTTATGLPQGLLHPSLLSKDKRSKWLDHLNSFQESNHDVDVQMQEFIKVPGAVEKTLSFGFLICFDSFLYVCTILPIRFAWSCVLLSLHYFYKWTKKPPGNYQFHRRHSYQLIQVSIIFLVYRSVLLPISIGKLYHWIRGQAMIKLYVLVAIVEVFDRLMCSLGQDCLDSMYWNTTRRPHSSRMLISVAVVVAYTAMHSLILLLHVATLNVAMNSADEALLALLIAGNFAEIKSTVFKKYNKPSLFKIVTSDICERFKLALFLGLVLILNYCQGMDSRKMSDYQRIAGIVWMSELLCDWLKHAFITKFNFIPSSVYPEYGLLLAGDVSGIGHEGVNLDHSHAVVKRIGFAQMPLVCIMARLLREAVKYMSMKVDMNNMSVFKVVMGSVAGWLLLLGLKRFLGAYLQRTSVAQLYAAPALSQTPLSKKQKQK